MPDTPPPPPPPPDPESSSVPPPPPDPSLHAHQAPTPGSPSGSDARRGNGLGIAGFVVALVGLLLFWIPVFGVVLAVVGVTLSAVGLRASRKYLAPHKGLSIAGLVLGLIALVVSILFTILVFVVADEFIDCADILEEAQMAPAGSAAAAEALERWAECIEN